MEEIFARVGCIRSVDCSYRLSGTICHCRL